MPRIFEPFGGWISTAVGTTESEAAATVAYQASVGSSKNSMVIVRADLMVGILTSTLSSSEVALVNCWLPPPEAETFFSCDNWSQAVIRRMLPMPVPAGNFVVLTVLMPSRVTLLVTTVLARTTLPLSRPQPEVSSR